MISALQKFALRTGVALGVAAGGSGLSLIGVVTWVGAVGWTCAPSCASAQVNSAQVNVFPLPLGGEGVAHASSPAHLLHPHKLHSVGDHVAVRAAIGHRDARPLP